MISLKGILPSSPIPFSQIEEPKKSGDFAQNNSVEEITVSKAHPLFDEFDLLQKIRKEIDDYHTLDQKQKTTNWKHKTDQALDLFIEHTSLFGILSMIDPHLSFDLSTQLIRDSINSDRSLCDLYLDRCANQLSLFRRVQIKWRYFFFFQSGLISYTVEHLAHNVLHKMRLSLASEKNLTAFLEIALTQTNSFLSDYLKALEAFAQGDGQGDRELFLQSKLKQPINTICIQFGETATREFFSKDIEFFRSWKKSESLTVRILTKISTWPIQKLLNLFLRTTLKAKIPSLTRSLIESSHETLGQNNLPFAVSITRGILKQLLKFKEEINAEQSNSTAAPIEDVQGAHKLPEVVTNLLEVLELEPYKTRSQLREALNKKRGSQEITENLQESIIDGCKTFFAYFSNPENSEEFFYQFLDLSNAPFIEKAPSTQEEWTHLKNEYLCLTSAMKKEAESIFRIVIRRSVMQRVHGISDEEMLMKVQAYCDLEKSHLEKTVQNLEKHLDGFEKTFQKENDPTFCLQALDAFVKQIYDYCNETNPEQKNLDMADFSPAFRLGMQLSRKKSLAYFATLCHTALIVKSSYLKQIHETHLQKTLHQLTEQLKGPHSSASEREASRIWLECQDLLEQQSSLLEASPEMKQLLQDFNSFKQMDELLIKEQSSLQALRSLSKNKGLLIQWIREAAKKSIETNSSFQWTTTRAQIDILCDVLPYSEKALISTHLTHIQHATSLDEVKTFWKSLKKHIEEMYTNHAAKEKKLSRQSSQRITQTRNRIEKQLTSSTEALKKSKQALNTSLHSIHTTQSQLFEAIPLIQPTAIETFDQRILRHLGGWSSISGAALGALAGRALSHSSVSYWALPAFGAALGSLRAIQTKGSSMVAQAAVGAALGGAIETFPGAKQWTPLAVGAAGWLRGEKTYKEALSTYADRHIVPEIVDEVMRKFTSFYNFTLQEQIWRWAVINTVDTLNNTHRNNVH